MSALKFIAFLILGLFLFYVPPIAAQTTRLRVTITHPTEHETLYASPEAYLFSVKVEGWVETSNPEPSLVRVRLDILRGAQITGSLTTRVSADGSFAFPVEVNPGATEFNDLHTTCPDCHYASALALPRGPVTLRVTVTEPSGAQAIAERRIIVDRSDYVSVPVQVMDADAPTRALANIAVTGSTRLYLWRARSMSGTTDATGLAQVRVEALAESTSRYVFQIAPTIVNGVLYQGVETKELVLKPGQTNSAPIVLRARGQRGQITGRLDVRGMAFPLTVRAIDPATGATMAISTTQDGFAFRNVPATQYVLALDRDELAARALDADPGSVDLARAPSAHVTTTLTTRATSTRLVRGKINAAPFAWVMLDGETRATRVNPATGEFALYNVSPSARTLVATAPGFFSQVVAIKDDTLNSLALAPRPALQKIAWGSGALWLPPETRADVAPNRIALENGWVWGEGDGAFTVETAEAIIASESARFAIERTPSRAWLIVLKGNTRVTFRATQTWVNVGAGQMLALDARSPTQVVPFDPIALRVLSEGERNPLNVIVELSLDAQVRDMFARWGINVAQILTFATFTLIVLALGIAPLLAWRVWRRR